MQALWICGTWAAFKQMNSQRDNPHREMGGQETGAALRAWMTSLITGTVPPRSALLSVSLPARGRTNLELREKFILPEGASQGMTPFRSRGRRSKPSSRAASPTRSSSSASQSNHSCASMPSSPATPASGAKVGPGGGPSCGSPFHETDAAAPGGGRSWEGCVGRPAAQPQVGRHPSAAVELCCSLGRGAPAPPTSSAMFHSIARSLIFSLLLFISCSVLISF